MVMEELGALPSPGMLSSNCGRREKEARSECREANAVSREDQREEERANAPRNQRCGWTSNPTLPGPSEMSQSPVQPLSVSMGSPKQLAPSLHPGGMTWKKEFR